jgi:hypothetical protein
LRVEEKLWGRRRKARPKVREGARARESLEVEDVAQRDEVLVPFYLYGRQIEATHENVRS